MEWRDSFGTVENPKNHKWKLMECVRGSQRRCDCSVTARRWIELMWRAHCLSVQFTQTINHTITTQNNSSTSRISGEKSPNHSIEHGLCVHSTELPVRWFLDFCISATSRFWHALEWGLMIDNLVTMFFFLSLSVFQSWLSGPKHAVMEMTARVLYARQAKSATSQLHGNDSVYGKYH